MYVQVCCFYMKIYVNEYKISILYNPQKPISLISFHCNILQTRVEVKHRRILRRATATMTRRVLLQTMHKWSIQRVTLGMYIVLNIYYQLHNELISL